jgi:hypothetical protein
VLLRYFLGAIGQSDLTVTRTNAVGRSRLTPREYWRKQFHPAERDREPDRRGRPIPDVGEEAYWTGNRFAGALYVLRGETFLRISVGGIRDEQARIEASKALALAALKRLRPLASEITEITERTV